jgi:hypothetical protein
MSWDGGRAGRETEGERRLSRVMPAKPGILSKAGGDGLGPPRLPGGSFGQAALASFVFSRTKA